PEHCNRIGVLLARDSRHLGLCAVRLFRTVYSPQAGVRHRHSHSRSLAGAQLAVLRFLSPRDM
ncbi:hypothetical protein OE165_27785, partial [Escherichia coli]|uniref:hypothetical protein n=1 Tax=Escherichia coli TaxID=562 RepID=UPI0021F38944